MDPSIRSISPLGAAEVVGFDCGREPSPEDWETIRVAFRDFPILCFRRQNLTATQQARFSRRWGPLETQVRPKYGHPDDTSVLILSNEKNPDGTQVGIVDAGDFWHSDSSHVGSPCWITMLHAIKNPTQGGDTGFINMCHVWDALPESLKQRIRGRYGIHHVAKTLNKRVTVSQEREGAIEFYKQQERSTPAVLQPLVRTHPETGQQSVYASPRFTIGIAGTSENDADELLDQLFASFIGNPKFIYYHKWQDHDLVMWDNSRLCHMAMGGYHYPDTRRMHRTSIAGPLAFYRPEDTILRSMELSS